MNQKCSLSWRSSQYDGKTHTDDSRIRAVTEGSPEVFPGAGWGWGCRQGVAQGASQRRRRSFI